MDKIYIIAILKDNCIYCREFKNEYWNDDQYSWKNIVKDYGFIPWTIDINITNEKIMREHLISNGINYITTFPFIMATRENMYNIDEVFVFCCKLVNGKFVYDNSKSPCRTTTNFLEWLDNVKQNL